jgi:hypothetical protein
MSRGRFVQIKKSFKERHHMTFKKITYRTAARVAVVAVIACMLVLLITIRVDATTLAHMSLAQMARAAENVVRVHCVDTTSRFEQGSIWTISTFEVLEEFKGHTQQTIYVRVPGGRAGHLTMSVEGVPKFQAEDEGVLFLEKTRMGDYLVTAWTQGVFRIRKQARGEATITQDFSAAAFFGNRAGQLRNEKVVNLPLSEFRKQLSQALAESSASGELQ